MTLFDVGAKFPEGREALIKGLEQLGYSLKDIKRIIISHAHVDHFGLAAEIIAEGGAEVWAYEGAVERLEQHEDRWDAELNSLLDLYELLGVPKEFLGPFKKSRVGVKRAAASVKVDKVLADGEVIDAGNRHFKVLHTPGHSPDSICLYNEKEGLLLSGDVLIESGASYLALDLHPPGERKYPWRGCLEDYMNSLDRLATLEIKRVFPGHGRPFARAQEIVLRNMNWYKQLKERILYALHNRDSITPYLLAIDLFPELKGNGLHQAIALVLNCLEELENEGWVEIILTEGGYKVMGV